MALSNPLDAFVWGAGGAQLSPEQIARQREIASALMGKGIDTSPVGDWTQGLARVLNSAAGAYRNSRADKAEAANASGSQSRIAALLGGMTGGGAAQFPAAPGAGDGTTYTTNAPGAGSTVSSGGTADMSGNQIYSEFMDAVKSGGVTNPNALAAIASTGNAESRFSPGNVYRTWSDPSESGAAGNAGGIMSWRGPRLEAMQRFAAANGGDPNKPSPALQAQFLLQEDPNLIVALNAAKSPEEAQRLMNNAWKFAGYNREGGEAARRIASANSFASQFGQAPAVAAVNALAQGQPTQVASLDPSSGMANDLVQRPGVTGIAQPIPNAPASLAALSPEAAATPVAANTIPMQPGPMAADPAHAAFVDRMTSPQSMTGGAPMPMQVMPQQVAQAQSAGPDISGAPVTSGNAPASSPGMNPGMQAAIAQALSNPNASPAEKQIATILLQQQMQQNDPARALDMRYKQAQLDALTNPKPEPTNDMREYEFAKSQGFPGSFVDFIMAQKKAGATTISDIGNTKGETEYDKALGKNLADKTVAIIDAGQQAPNKLATYQQLSAMLPNVYTGAGGDSVLAAKRVAKSLGIDVGDVSDAEFVQAMGNQMALELRNPAGGAGMPGAMSDSDRTFLASMSPGLSKTPQGNQKLLEYRMAVEKRNVQVAQRASDYMNTHGGRLDNGFFSELAQWSAQNPLFPQTPKKTTTPDGYTIEEVE